MRNRPRLERKSTNQTAETARPKSASPATIAKMTKHSDPITPVSQGAMELAAEQVHGPPEADIGDILSFVAIRLDTGPFGCRRQLLHSRWRMLWFRKAPNFDKYAPQAHSLALGLHGHNDGGGNARRCDRACCHRTRRPQRRWRWQSLGQQPKPCRKVDCISRSSPPDCTNPTGNNPSLPHGVPARLPALARDDRLPTLLPSSWVLFCRPLLLLR